MKKSETLVVASNNKDKIAEIRAILGDRFKKIYAPAELGIKLAPDENGTTFEENAKIKCDAFASRAPGRWVLADDSGLCVDALGGAPGIYSARYAGERGTGAQCIKKLLSALYGVENRRAHFVSVLVLRAPDGQCFTADGTVEGCILTSCDGNGGFGYDPVFFCDEINQSFGAASADEKNAVSHRARALSRLNDLLANG